VCFLARVTPDRVVEDARAVARGNRAAVLAVARDAPEGGVLIHNHPSGNLEPSDADLAVAARCYEEGLGTAIVDNDATRLYVVVEPPEPRVVVPLDPDELEAIVAPEGELARRFEGYEDRPGQREMLRLVAERYNRGGVAIVEAGTGTGKSLAYLLPAARWALQNDERTVVSTNTINLQEQLVQKDLPLVADLLGEDLTWALVKGRGNYVSIRRAHLATATSASLFEDDRSSELSAIVEWTERTRDGSLSDLSFVPAEDTWEEVRSDPDICLRSRCPHFQACFYQRSRRRAGGARILVVNHHLLFTDLAVRRATDNFTQAAVLPPYRHVILDEAHNLEDAATSHLGVEVTRRALFRTLARLDRQGKGVLAAVRDALPARDGGFAGEIRRRVDERTRPAVDEARAAAGALVDDLERLVPGRGGEAVRIGGAEGLDEPAADDLVRERLDALLGALSRLEREVEELRRRLEIDETLQELLAERLLDLQSLTRRIAAQQQALRLVLTPDAEQARWYVRWLEVRGRGPKGNVALGAAPIELGPILRDSLFGPADSVVLTSATLATRRSFDFLRSRLGLDDGRDDGERDEDREELEVIEAIVPSPFDFQTQTIFAVPSDLSDARTGRGGVLADGGAGAGAGQAGFQEETARVIQDLAGVTDGGLFALFTSHGALRTVAGLLRASGADLRWPLFVQGEDDRARLLAGFIEARNGILVGTSSFWEGVDVPGHPLRGLVIQKLPFRVPTEPVTAARVEALEREGVNAFWGYMLPLAALRLKQGFGRLVRSRRDRGAVVLLDDRILRKRYGAYLRDSLPDAPLVKGPWSEVLTSLRRFYEGGA
jgi:ATP-dependent DNA helicase DinG